ncbi:hypothetical protein H257_18994 [Aphanomyces astaci]|uniref:AB hydrolase-1 domain-containing protein n=1 Tax=Aphanomyces astaci TaxID=112090 RepID=W4F9F0_APHAT|nr:hypothetical protein H257_18994 [Aphanomyces astaci]ETV64067.1 hypothetical protein H257_18994 [Aphanomyces astaci]|eukprot:XP_009846451.1 hypothetical protein H257_18994 [Aphanomyces astaci]
MQIGMRWHAVALSALVACISMLFTSKGQGVLVYLNFPAFLWFGFDTPTQPHLGCFPGLPHTSNHYISSTNDVTLGLWYTQASHVSSNKLVLYLHGNGEHRGMSVSVLKHGIYANPPFHADILSVDYRGFGDSTFTWPTEQGLYDDAHAAFNYAISTLGFAPHQVVVHGYSLGSAVASRLVYDLCQNSTCPAGLLLEAPFLSIPDIVSDYILGVNVPSWLLNLYHRFPTKTILGNIPIPTWIVHGSLDSVVPFRHGHTLATMFPHSTMGFCPVPGARHMTSFDFDEARTCVMRTFWSNIWTQCYRQTAMARFRRALLQETLYHCPRLAI